MPIAFRLKDFLKLKLSAQTVQHSIHCKSKLVRVYLCQTVFQYFQALTQDMAGI